MHNDYFDEEFGSSPFYVAAERKKDTEPGRTWSLMTPFFNVPIDDVHLFVHNMMRPCLAAKDVPSLAMMQYMNFEGDDGKSETWGWSLCVLMDISQVSSNVMNDLLTCTRVNLLKLAPAFMLAPILNGGPGISDHAALVLASTMGLCGPETVEETAEYFVMMHHLSARNHNRMLVTNVSTYRPNDAGTLEVEYVKVCKLPTKEEAHAAHNKFLARQQDNLG